MDDFFKIERARDNLTGLYSREVIVEFAGELVSRGEPFSLGLIDIDNFKYINDSYGHIAGDKIIKTVSNRIQDILSEHGAVGRFGGDEFIFILQGMVDYDAVWSILRSLRITMNNGEIPEFEGLFVTVTMGVSRFPKNGATYDEIFEMADKALYRGKTKGRNCFIIYLPEKHASLNLHSENDKSLSSMYLHSLVFRLLTMETGLSDGIRALFTFFSSYLMLDHICIQTNDNKIHFEKTHELSRNQSFRAIDLALIRNNINSASDIFYTNKAQNLDKQQQPRLQTEYKEQGIQSTFNCEISCRNVNYGMLRVDSTSARIWQRCDMDILITAAKTIALMLNDSGKTIDSIEN